MLTEVLTKRLEWFSEDYCEVSESVVHVRERESPGSATLRCTTNSLAIAFNLHRKPFSPLKNQQCADGIVFDRIDAASWRMHVVELKRTIRFNNWREMKNQFEGAILNGYALAGILGIKHLTQVICCSAFRYNAIDSNPNLYKASSGSPVSASIPLDWRHDRLEMLSLKNIIHKKIRLDESSGEGTLDLTDHEASRHI